MRPTHPIVAAVLMAIALLIPQHAAAQTTMSSQPWEVPLEALKAQVHPLFAEELEAEAAKWMDILKVSVQETSQLRLQGESAAEQLVHASTKKEAIIERFDVILDAWEAKGGDATTQRDYIDAVGGAFADVDPTNVGALATYIENWLIDPDGGIKLGINIIKFIVVLVLFWILSRIVARIVRIALNRIDKTSELLENFLVGSARRAILLIGIVVAITYLGVNITPLVAAIGAAGLVIGLALQGTLSNFASGILILIYRPYDVGDVISAGGVTGKVEHMNLVSTRVATFDNQVMLVPNNEIWNGVITNITARDTRRVDLTFGIGYDDDIAKAERIISEIVSAHGKVLPDPAPVIKVHELADNSVNFVVRPWSAAADYWDVYWDITRKVKERFDAEDIGIPFPQRDIHIPNNIRVTMDND